MANALGACGTSVTYIGNLGSPAIHPVYSEFVMADQKLDEQVAPGKSWLTFIPSEEEAVQLNGDLVWRFHFRKGYHPRSFNGVTTLVDVEFSSQDITDESGAS